MFGVVISLVVACLLLGLVDGMMLFVIVGEGDCIWLLSAFFVVSSLNSINLQFTTLIQSKGSR
jgi:hypothetical protein